MKVLITEQCMIGGKTKKVGEKVEVSDSDASTLCAMGRASKNLDLKLPKKAEKS